MVTVCHPRLRHARGMRFSAALMWCYYAYGVGHASGMGVGVYALLGHHISLTLMWCYYACGVGHASGMGCKKNNI